MGDEATSRVMLVSKYRHSMHAEDLVFRAVSSYFDWIRCFTPCLFARLQKLQLAVPGFQDQIQRQGHEDRF